MGINAQVSVVFGGQQLYSEIPGISNKYRGEFFNGGIESDLCRITVAEQTGRKCLAVFCATGCIDVENFGRVMSLSARVIPARLIDG